MIHASDSVFPRGLPVCPYHAHIVPWRWASRLLLVAISMFSRASTPVPPRGLPRHSCHESAIGRWRWAPRLVQGITTLKVRCSQGGGLV